MPYDVCFVPLPARFRSEIAMDDDAFLAFCRANDGLRIERESSGEIVMLTPAGGRSDRRGLFIARELDYWAEADGRGVVFGSSAGFILPDGSMLSPDAAWVRSAAWEALTPELQEKLLPFCPPFVSAPASIQAGEPIEGFQVTLRRIWS